MFTTFILLLALASGQASTTSQPKSNFVTVKLPRGVAVSVPRNWELLSENQRVTLDTSVEASLDLANLGRPTSELPFAANYYDENREAVGILNVRYYPKMDVGQDLVRSISPPELEELDRTLRSSLEASGVASGFKISEWLGTKQETINGLGVLVTSYVRIRNGETSVYLVRLFRVLAESRSFTLTVSCRNDDQVLAPICNRIGQSIRLDD